MNLKQTLESVQMTAAAEVTRAEKALEAAQATLTASQRHHREVSECLALCDQLSRETNPKTPDSDVTASTKVDGRSKEARAARAAAQSTGGTVPKVRAKADKIPSITQAMTSVMGSLETMSKDDVYEALQAKGWLPNSDNPKGYILTILSSKMASDGEHLFTRVARGMYRLHQVEMVDLTETKEEAEAEDPPSNGASENTDAFLQENGMFEKTAFSA